MPAVPSWVIDPTVGREIVLDECTLSRPDVAPGMHRLDAFRYRGEGPGAVVVADENDIEVLSLASEGAGDVVTTEQTYTFTCTVGGDVNTANLTSKS